MVHTPEYYSLHKKLTRIQAEKQLIIDYMEAINKKDFAIDSILRSEVSDKKLYNSM